MIASKRYSCPPGIILLLSAKSGDVDRASSLLRSGKLDPDATRDARGNTALHIAAIHGHVDVARALVAAGASTESATPGERLTPLRLAVERGMLRTARVLLDAGADIAARDSVDRATPLHAAAEAGHASVVLELVRRGADLEAKAVSGQTSLRWALSFGRAEAAKALLGAGADPDAPDRLGLCCLHAVAAFRYEEGAVSSSVCSSLSSSSCWSPAAMAELLLSAGASPDFCCARCPVYRSLSTTTAATTAAAGVAAVSSLSVAAANVGSNGNNHGGGRAGGRERERVGIGGRGGVGVRRRGGGVRGEVGGGRGGGGRGGGGGGGGLCRPGTETPLHVAARESSVEVVRVLLRSGADPNARTSAVEGRLSSSSSLSLSSLSWLSPLHCTAAPGDDRGQRAIVRLLLRAGADIDAVCSDRMTTPLRLACQNSAVGCVEELLRWGADDSDGDDRGVACFPFSRVTHRSQLSSVSFSSCSALSIHSAGASAAAGAAAASSSTMSYEQPGGGSPVSLPLSPFVCSGGGGGGGGGGGAEGVLVQHQPPSSRPPHVLVASTTSSACKPKPTLEDLIGTRVPASARDPADDKKIRELLRKAPADRAWKRRGWLVMLYCRYNARGPASARFDQSASVSKEELVSGGGGGSGRRKGGGRVVVEEELVLRQEGSSGCCFPAGFAGGKIAAGAGGEGSGKLLGGFPAGGGANHKEACLWPQHQQMKSSSSSSSSSWPSHLRLSYQSEFAVRIPEDECDSIMVASPLRRRRRVVKRTKTAAAAAEMLAQWKRKPSVSCRLRGKAPAVFEIRTEAFARGGRGLGSSGDCPMSETEEREIEMEIEVLREVARRLFQIQGDQSVFRRVLQWL